MQAILNKNTLHESLFVKGVEQLGLGTCLYDENLKEPQNDMIIGYP